ncbi:hypothetical protein [Acidovorax sp. Root219]|uniref:hypothetical protein n=1 Tax=Acidovorax sp. Root219 TaxID=1736493 RepID=UPI00070B5227|nr:hypothetical protein [Acidovorax sp. Root219]KRC36244.1 hypothetical protein ASE28_01540 [Acidovorax sp. Root219]
MAYTQDQINAAYASEKANGASDADLARVGAEKYGVTADQFNLASQAWGTTPDQSSYNWASTPTTAAAPVASAPAAAPADRFTQAQYDEARGWATGKSFDQIGAKASELGLTAAEVGKIFGQHGGSGQQVMDASKYGTDQWDGFQKEAAKWTFSGSGWDYDSKAPPKTGINLSQLQGMTKWEVSPNETVRSQLQQIIADDSPLMQQARARAMQQSNTRGLLNSSMAATAGESALYDAAMPIAQQDASTYARAGEFNAGQANTFSRDNNQFVRDAYMADFNVQANEWAAQQQWDRDYKTLDRQQQLQLERDAIQNGYQTARDKFAAENQMSIAQLNAASQAANFQPDTSMARLNAQLDADDRRADRQTAADDRSTLTNLRSDYATKVFQINTSDMSPEKADRAISDLAATYNPQLTEYAKRLGYDPNSWVIKTTPASATTPAPAPAGPASGDTTGAGAA